MTRQTVDDELYEIKNYFYIGNYQQCINEARKLKLVANPELAIQREIFIYRSYIAQNKFLLVMNEIGHNADSDLKSLKLLCEYKTAKTPSQRQTIVSDLDKKINTSDMNGTLALMAGNIYCSENMLDAAYRVLHVPNCLEAKAVLVNILLKLDRIDLAKKKLKEMQDSDDDAILTQLAQAWINIAEGKEKLQDAFYIYHELSEKFGMTPVLANGKAVALIGQGKYEEAESILIDAISLDPNFPDTLINLTVVSGITNNKEESSRYFSQLKDVDAQHAFLQDYDKKLSEFTKNCQIYNASSSTMS